MTTLNFGVIDMPYRNNAKVYKYRGKTGKSRPRRVSTYVMGKTTFDIAKILEARYHVMEVFYELHHQEMADMLGNAYAGAVETALMRGKMPKDPAISAMGKIKKQFNDYLDLEEMAGIVPGVPTQAALHGVSHRFKHPYAKRPRRPSFIDTGLYESSFLAWIEY